MLFQRAPLHGTAQTKRLVVIKRDGLPYDFVEKFVKERDPQTGKSTLPWIDYIFHQRGTGLSNFYVRGMSLSAPSWSLLDTGQHLQLKGNVEFDRYTLHSYDYLNFIPLYIARINGSRIDMPGVEELDALGIPLLADAYRNDERYLGFPCSFEALDTQHCNAAYKVGSQSHPRISLTSGLWVLNCAIL